MIREAYEAYAKSPSIKSLIESWQGLAFFKCRRFKSKDKTGIKIKQNPYELAACLNFLRDRNVSGYSEVDLKSEGLFYFMDSFFQTVSNQYQKSYCYDKQPHILFDSYVHDNPHASFVKVESFSEFSEEASSDLVMVDLALRQEEPIMEVVESFWNDKSTRFIMLHDIEDSRYKLKNVFQHFYLKQNGEYSCYRFWDEKRKGPGIGLIERNS